MLIFFMKAADIWVVGVINYILVYKAKSPFEGRNNKQIFENIIKRKQVPFDMMSMFYQKTLFCNFCIGREQNVLLLKRHYSIN